jgi:hypothetical protein
MLKLYFTFLCLFLIQTLAWSQKKDSTVTTRKDTVGIVSKRPDSLLRNQTQAKKHDPKKATLYSAILPGAGQVYNKKYWKVPIVWTAIGIPTYTYFYNKSWYQKCQYALAVTIGIQNGSTNQDSLNAVDPKLLPLVQSNQQTSIINYRDYFRKNQDYSVLFVLLFWGLNIVDATVDAHLKDFNVNNDLSFRIRPYYMPGPNPMASLSFEFDIHKPKPRLLQPLN